MEQQRGNIRFPSPKLVLRILLGFMVILFVYELSMTVTNYLPRPIDVSNISVNEHLDWEIKKSVEERWYLSIEGFVFNKSRPPTSSSIIVILRNMVTGDTIALPTVFDQRNDLPVRFDLDEQYSSSGFTAKTVMKLLQLSKYNYKIELFYSDHQKNFLIETGQTIPFEND